jgi:hypothetical protein
VGWSTLSLSLALQAGAGNGSRVASLAIGGLHHEEALLFCTVTAAWCFNTRPQTGHPPSLQDGFPLSFRLPFPVVSTLYSPHCCVCAGAGPVLRPLPGVSVACLVYFDVHVPLKIRSQTNSHPNEGLEGHGAGIFRAFRFLIVV